MKHATLWNSNNTSGRERKVQVIKEVVAQMIFVDSRICSSMKAEAQLAQTLVERCT